MPTADRRAVMRHADHRLRSARTGSMTRTRFDRLVALLKELFQLDKPDLDFGFYRVMHAKASGYAAGGNAHFDVVYANGDHSFEALRPEDRRWTGLVIEDRFKQLMFEGDDGAGPW